MIYSNKEVKVLTDKNLNGCLSTSKLLDLIEKNHNYDLCNFWKMNYTELIKFQSKLEKLI